MIWSQLDLGYLAGLIEGEGCFSLRSDGGLPRFAMGMTDEDTICELPKRFGIGTVSGPYEKGGNRKLVWEWHVNNRKELARLLLAVYPQMCTRRKEKISQLANTLKEFSTTVFCEGCNSPILFKDRSFRVKRYCSRKCNMRHYMREKRARK